MAGKRGAGEGTIRQRPGGLWEVRLMVGTKPDGRPDIRSRYGKTRQEVQRKLADLRRRADSGDLRGAKAERQTLAAYLDTWLQATAATVRPRTHVAYAAIVRLHLVPALGRHKLTALRPEQVQAWHAAELAAGRAPLSIRKYQAVLHKALADGIRWGHLARNPCGLVDLPAVTRRELHPPSPADLARLLATADAAGDPLAALWTLAVHTGCRRGELLGLRWGDVDLQTGAIGIQRSLQSVRAGVPTFGAPKTPRSRRALTIAAEALDALRAHRQRQLAERLAIGADYADYGLIFATRLGTALAGRNVHRAFKAALARAELPASVRFHDLRHAAATLLLEAGVPLKVASERLGHGGIGITADLYQHVRAGQEADAAERLAALLRPAKSR